MSLEFDQKRIRGLNSNLGPEGHIDLKSGLVERLRAEGRRRPRHALMPEALPKFSSPLQVIEELRPTEPIFCIDSQELRRTAKQFFPFPGRVLYAVKCNPHPNILKELYDAGITDFDVASLQEIEQIGAMFGSSAGMFFNNPAKSRPAIECASQQYGIRFYTVDCAEEIEKIFEEARVDDELVIAVRLATAARDARYTLTTKFGAQADVAVSLLQMIHDLGIGAGISFHVGSQCLSANSFRSALALSGRVIARAGVPIRVLNVGGGFPASYPGEVLESLEDYLSQVMIGYRDLSLGPSCVLLCEPGRSLVATAGSVITQVVVRRGKNLFLNDGVFGTLQELVDPAERRPVRLVRVEGTSSSEMTEFKVYGPTCDSNDVLGAPFFLPDDTREGDWLQIDMMGAYSLAMRTKFNGFHTDQVVLIDRE